MPSDAANPAMKVDDPHPKAGRLVVGCLAVVILAVVVGIGLAISGVWVSLKAEENLHATQYVITVVDQFVYEHRRWPTSWDELETVALNGDNLSPLNESLDEYRRIGQYSRYDDWPRSSAHLQTCVEIDFKVDVERVARQDRMEFAAIKPRGAYYEYRDSVFVESLQETLRQVQAGRPPPSNSPHPRQQPSRSVD